MNKKTVMSFAASITVALLVSCSPEYLKPAPEAQTKSQSTDNTQIAASSAPFVFGADLSYVNQILDKGGVYKDNGVRKDPYQIFADHGTNLVRLRLWHNPTWTKEVYGSAGTQLYNDIADVEKAIQRARGVGSKILVDFHYSDRWADPGNQYAPAAWKNITSLAVLKDSIYNYTFKTLSRLKNKGLMPDYIQVGNETNCGMLYSEAQPGFPSTNVCDGQWSNLGQVMNSAIKAVRDASVTSTIKTKIMLHVGGPENVDWWFDSIISQANVTDFDVVGFSYYPLWTNVPVDRISDNVWGFKNKYNRQVMILETAYPWTKGNADGYGNVFGGKKPLSGFQFTQQGQYNLLVKLTQEVKSGGGDGIIYWEPAWITSNLKDLWGTGSSWDDATLFDFSGNTIKGIDYARYAY